MLAAFGKALSHGVEHQTGPGSGQRGQPLGQQSPGRIRAVAEQHKGLLAAGPRSERTPRPALGQDQFLGQVGVGATHEAGRIGLDRGAALLRVVETFPVVGQGVEAERGDADGLGGCGGDLGHEVYLVTPHAAVVFEGQGHVFFQYHAPVVLDGESLAPAANEEYLYHVDTTRQPLKCAAMANGTPAKSHPLLAEGRMLVMPGVFDPLSAKLAERAGFPAVFVSGYAVAASHLGVPDFGLLTQTELVAAVRRIVAAVDVGVIVDGDTGYGGPLNVRKLVGELRSAGAMGVVLEDQTWPKRCGHMRGKSVIEAGEHAAKIRAAADARDGERFIITARTDALETDGMEEALRRARLYKEAGADVLFVEGPRSREELELIGKELPPPLAVNLVDGGNTPHFRLEELEEMGFFSVGFVVSGLYAAASALERTYRHLLEHGSTEALRGSMMSFDEFNDMIGVEKFYAEDERYKA